MKGLLEKLKAEANARGLVTLEQQADEALGMVRGAGKLDVVFKNVLYADFIKTFAATEEQYRKAYQLWGEEKWDELYKYFVENNLNDKWPPYNGVKRISKTETGNQLAGKVFDRFQGSGEISGQYASPVYNGEGLEDLYFTYDSRALKDNIKEGTSYIKFKIKENIPDDVRFEFGEVIPWWGKQGLGDQVKSSAKFLDLWNNGKGVIEILEQ